MLFIIFMQALLYVYAFGTNLLVGIITITIQLAIQHR